MITEELTDFVERAMTELAGTVEMLRLETGGDATKHLAIASELQRMARVVLKESVYGSSEQASYHIIRIESGCMSRGDL